MLAATSAEHAGAEHRQDIRLLALRQHRDEVLRVVFQVSVLDDEILALGGSHTLAHRVALHPVLLLQNHAQFWLVEAEHDLASTVCRAIINNDDFFV